MTQKRQIDFGRRYICGELPAFKSSPPEGSSYG